MSSPEDSESESFQSQMSSSDSEEESSSTSSSYVASSPSGSSSSSSSSSAPGSPQSEAAPSSISSALSPYSVSLGGSDIPDSPRPSSSDEDKDEDEDSEEEEEDQTIFNFDALPPELLMMILNWMPIQEQLPYRLVSTKWCLSIEANCQLKRSLHIYHGDYSLYHQTIRDMDRYCHSGERIDYWSTKTTNKSDDLILNMELLLTEAEDFVPFLARLFPELERLLIWCCYIQSNIYPAITELLGYYQNSLTALSISAWTSQRRSLLGEPNPTPVTAALAQAITSLGKLSRLDLYTDITHHLVADLTPVLPRLTSCFLLNAHEFDRHTDYHRVSYGRHLAQLSPACTRLIACAFDLQLDDDAPGMATFSAEQAAAIQHLVLIGKIHRPLNANAITAFTGLQSLTLVGSYAARSVINRNLLQILTSLSSLTKLKLANFRFSPHDIVPPGVADSRLCTAVRKLVLTGPNIQWLHSHPRRRQDRNEFQESFRSLAQWFPALEHIIVHVTTEQNRRRLQGRLLQRVREFLSEKIRFDVFRQNRVYTEEWAWKVGAGRHRGKAVKELFYNDFSDSESSDYDILELEDLYDPGRRGGRRGRRGGNHQRRENENDAPEADEEEVAEAEAEEDDAADEDEEVEIWEDGYFNAEPVDVEI